MHKLPVGVDFVLHECIRGKVGIAGREMCYLKLTVFDQCTIKVELRAQTVVAKSTQQLASWWPQYCHHIATGQREKMTSVCDRILNKRMVQNSSATS